nr:putative phosphoglucosamine mutase [uncultured bacterium]
MESALEAGLNSAGVDVGLLYTMPTPAIAYLTRTSRAGAGIVISASHNLYQDNGIKFFTRGGAKLGDDAEAAIEKMMARPLTMMAARHLGKTTSFDGAAGRYIEFCKSTIPDRDSLDGLKLVVDCANGAAYQVAPQLLRELGAEVAAIGDRPDGFNINHGCGSTSLGALGKAVAAHGAACGIALDGDGDRLIMVDAAGNTVDGDRLLFILAAGRHAAGSLSGGVVGTTMSNIGLARGLAGLGIPFARSAVGDRHVLAELYRRGWILGGEASGHLICLDKNTTGDGIIAALEVLHRMTRAGRTLAELAAPMPAVPQATVNVPLASAAADRVLAAGRVQDAIADAESALGEGGRVLLRPSGTQPLMRVMAEGEDAAAVQRAAGDIADAVRESIAAVQ